MTSEEDLRQDFNAQVPFLRAWGSYVEKTLKEMIATEIGGDVELGKFLKIPTNPRIKDVDSFIEKAYRKSYSDPILQTTDKVGIRFVVLLTTDIETISRLVESSEKWNSTISKDFLEERINEPSKFEYQSQHFDVGNPAQMEWDGSSIPPGTNCEIQIRTLLQHAYCELSHDKIYKPKLKIQPDVFRKIARGMALIETTDDIFVDVAKILNEGEKKLNDRLENIINVWTELIQIPIPNTLKIDLQLIQDLGSITGEMDVASLRELLTEKAYIINKIRERCRREDFYAHPIVLVIYWIVSRSVASRDELKRQWPLDSGLLGDVFSDLGIAMG